MDITVEQPLPAPLSPPVLGIDMGGTNLRHALVDAAGGTVRSSSEPLPEDLGLRAHAPSRVAARYRDTAAAIGLAVAGTVEDGVLVWSANLGLHDVDFRARLGEGFSGPVVVLNDARAAGLAEAVLGAGREAVSVLSITVGTGIGGALILDGRLVEGTGQAGEIGHMVIDPSGPPCNCGRRGCWEQLAGGRALARAAAELCPGEADPVACLVARAEAGDGPARATIDHAAELFGLGIDNLCAVLAPEVIILGGGIMARAGLVSDAYRTAARSTIWGGRTLIRDSRLGDAAGHLGAALAARAALA
ncbi:MAG: ROK family protein [Propionicimonas sp.]|nr:ROK family protein [Propionicimonas sp.]